LLFFALYGIILRADLFWNLAPDAAIIAQLNPRGRCLSESKLDYNHWNNPIMRHEIKFKTCSCGRVWASREAFVGDADIQPIGVTFAKDPPGIFYFFNHMTCESTLAVDVEEFRDLIEEPIPSADLSRSAPSTARPWKICSRVTSIATMRPTDGS
jgi:hypothetical protein